MEKSTVAITVIAVVIISIIGFLFALEILPSDNTTNNTNSTANLSTNNTTTVNNSTVSNQSKDNNPPPPPPNISADKARELAKKYVGPGVILEKPVLTTYKSVKAWQVPVYTKNHKFLNNIYIDARTGKKVD